MFILETFQKGNPEIGITPKSDTFLGNIYLFERLFESEYTMWVMNNYK